MGQNRVMEGVGKNMMLVLPMSEQQDFASEECQLLCMNENYNQAKLYKAENYTVDEDTGWTVTYLGELAYMSLNAPEQYRDRWSAAYTRFLELCKIHCIQNPVQLPEKKMLA